MSSQEAAEISWTDCVAQILSDLVGNFDSRPGCQDLVGDFDSRPGRQDLVGETESGVERRRLDQIKMNEDTSFCFRFFLSGILCVLLK